MMMKKTIQIFFIYLFAIAVLPSCKKTEDQPRDLYTYDLAFDPVDQDAVLAQRYLASLYNYLPTGFNRISSDFLDAATDDAVSIVSNAPVTYYTNGIISTGNNPESYWSNSYSGIRQVNIFLANIDKIPIPAANPNRTLGFKAEARFIRAFLYFELLKRYGGVPLIRDKIFTLDDNLQLSRNTFAECADYITSECDAIKTYLYADNIADPNLGRIVKGAAIALKCRVYLYAASPLYNGGGIETNPTLKAITGYPTADPTRWQKVVDAVTEFNALGYYVLLNVNGGGTPATGTTTYTNIFINRKNTEVILAKQTNNNFDIENANAPVGYSVNNATGAGRTNPTQNFVDAFTMISGKPITDPTSNYDPKNPYANRDPRLAASVFYNGSRWLNRAVETFDGGRDRPNNSSGPQTRTGYYLRKFTFDFSNSSSYSSNSHNFPYFRYAEIILNNAEALNELGRTSEAVAEIIKLRKRANIQAGTDSRYGIPAGVSQNDMRTLVQNERRVELSFEEQRFFDLRRWKLGNTELNKILNGIKITNISGVLTYQVVPVTNILFQDRLYHLPLPYDETVKDANLVQNFGW